MKKEPNNLEYIEWEDSYWDPQGWHPHDPDKVPHYMICQSVGWVHHETDDLIVVTPHQARSDDGEDRQGGGAMTIPKSAIRERRKLLPVEEISPSQLPVTLEVYDQKGEEVSKKGFREDFSGPVYEWLHRLRVDTQGYVLIDEDALTHGNTYRVLTRLHMETPNELRDYLVERQKTPKAIVLQRLVINAGGVHFEKGERLVRVNQGQYAREGSLPGDWCLTAQDLRLGDYQIEVE